MSSITASRARQASERRRSRSPSSSPDGVAQGEHRPRPAPAWPVTPCSISSGTPPTAVAIDRGRCRHRLHHDQRQALAPRREDERIRSRPAGTGMSSALPEQLDVIPSRSFMLAGEVRPTASQGSVTGDPHPGAEVGGVETLEGTEEVGVVLLGGEAGHAKQPERACLLEPEVEAGSHAVGRPGRSGRAPDAPRTLGPTRAPPSTRRPARRSVGP